MRGPPQTVTMKAMKRAVVFVNLTMIPERLGVPTVDGAYWTLFPVLKFYVLVLGLPLLGLRRHMEALFIAWPVLMLAAWRSVFRICRSQLSPPPSSWPSRAPHGQFAASTSCRWRGASVRSVRRHFL